MTALCWFRTDLRIEDQPALTAATQADQTIALFIVTPGQWRAHGDAPAKVDFWLRALHGLQRELDALNIPLRWIQVDTWDEVPAALLEFCQNHQINQVHCNREYGINERRRDRACYALLKEHEIDMTGHHGNTLLIPGTVKTGADQYYRVFTPFAKTCRERLRKAPYRLCSAPKKQASTGLPENDALPDSMPGWETPAPEIRQEWPASSEAAHLQLTDFAQSRMSRYQTDRDFPAVTGTSKLSPYLASGIVSAGQCLQAALQQNQGESDTGDRGITTWINEILWREFYQHLIFGFPILSMHQPLRAETQAVQWRHAPDDFKAWCEARTGVPIVDAAMRQLLATGWMHNRLRMVVAMYLTKNLLIDWRMGEAFFMQHLIDGELAANNGGWQWSASTGADSAPYFRVFNPVSQSEKFDPAGRFIRHWLPELASLSDRDIHDPSPISRRALNYPAQLVDLKSSRVRAIEAFSSLRDS
jgi:deoxyribodipyrimidine photo-lyase